MLVDGGLHNTAGAVALHGVADLFGGRQAHPGALAPRFEHVEHQRLVDIRLAAGIHAAKLAVAADGTIAHPVRLPSGDVGAPPGKKQCSVFSIAKKRRHEKLIRAFSLPNL